MAFKPCIYVFLTICALLTSQLHCAHNINTKLSQMCPTLATLTASNKNLIKIEKANVDMFLEYMTSEDALAIAEGSFGEVFITDSFTDIGKTQTRLDAVKLVKIAEDENQDSEDEQVMFAGEVRATFQLHKLDKHHLFFPAFRYCVEVTTEFANFKENEGELGKTDYIQLESGKAPFLIATQKLDMELWQFFNNVLSGNAVNFDIVNRIQMGINLFKGVIIMNTKLIHCDLKPENLMIKHITEAEAKLLAEQGLKVLEKNSGEYYQIFYIDFGLVQPITNEFIDCPGGTPGYLAKEYFQPGVSHDQADIFGIGLSLLNSESVSIRTDWISDLYEFIQINRRKKITSFTQTQISDISKMPMVKAMILLINKEENLEDIRTKVLAYYPKAQEDITRIFTDKNFQKDDPSKFMVGNVSLFEAFVDSALPYLPQFGMYFNRVENANIKRIVDSLKQINTKLTTIDQENPDYQKYINQMEILQLEKDIINKEILLKSKYWIMLLDTLKDKTKRPSAEVILDSLKTMLLEYKTENKEQLMKYDELKMTRLTDSLQIETDQDFIQEIKDVVQGRRQKMATIYGEGHQRRRRMIRI